MTFSPRTIATVLTAAAALSGSALAADTAPPASSAPGAAPACPAPDSKEVAFIKNPKWISHPSPEDVTKVFPAFEAKQHRRDHTVVDCAIADDGSLKDCTVVEDQRPHVGFDKATLSLTKLYKTAPLAEQTAFTSMPECVRKLGAPHVVIPMDWSATTTTWSGR